MIKLFAVTLVEGRKYAIYGSAFFKGLVLVIYFYFTTTLRIGNLNFDSWYRNRIKSLVIHRTACRCIRKCSISGVDFIRAFMLSTFLLLV